MALTKAQRTERARDAARKRWDRAGDEGREKQRLIMVSAHAAKLGYRLVPIDTTNENED